MKVAIIGAGLAGLVCALELEKQGIIADIYEKDNNPGWAWSEVSYWPNILYQSYGDQREYLKKEYDVDIKPLLECRRNIIKSPNHRVEIQGKLGYFVTRGKGDESIERQLVLQHRKVSIHYNSPVDFKELGKQYDWVVIATGRDKEARELGVWEDQGMVSIIQGIAIGSFDIYTGNMYLDTEYAGTGFARMTPFNSVQAILSLYIIGANDHGTEALFSKFLKMEGLDSLEILYRLLLPPYHNGRVKKFKIDNFLLIGRAAGLAESFIGTGSVISMASGVLAARAIANNIDFEQEMKPLQEHVDNISSFRKVLNGFDNKDFDKLLGLLDKPGIKQLFYNTRFNIFDFAGNIIQHFQKN